jgi:hypothetical protein
VEQVSLLLQPLLNMQLFFHEAGRLRANKFQLMSAESLKLRVFCTGAKDGRIVSTRSPRSVGGEVTVEELRALLYDKYPQTANGDQFTMNDADPSPKDPTHFGKDGVYGPLLFGTIVLEQHDNVLSSIQGEISGAVRRMDVAHPSDSGKERNSCAFTSLTDKSVGSSGTGDSQWSQLETTTVDIVGYIYAGPTSFVCQAPNEFQEDGEHRVIDSARSHDDNSQESRSGPSTLHGEGYSVSDMRVHMVCAENNSISDRAFILKEHCLRARAFSTSSGRPQELSFAGIATRFAGLPLKLPSTLSVESELYFSDSVTAVTEPPLFVLSPNQSLPILIQLVRR